MIQTHRATSVLLGLFFLLTKAKLSRGFLFEKLFGFGLIDGIVNGKFTCLTSFQLAGGFNLANREQYETYFRDDSVFTLAQTGSYKTVDGIKEYVGYIYNTTSDYYAYGAERLATESQVLGLNEQGRCVFRSALHSKYILNASVTETDDAFEVTSMVKLFLQPSGWFGLPSLFPVGEAAAYYPKVNFYLPPGFLEYIFVNQFGGTKTRTYICQVLTESCKGVLSSNNNLPASLDDCTDQLATLPPVDPDSGYVDGNSTGCRAVHASFAIENPHHCAHVALEPIPDSDGNYKCQTSEGIAISSLFTDSDLEFLETFQLEKGFEPEVGFALLPPEDLPL